MTSVFPILSASETTHPLPASRLQCSAILGHRGTLFVLAAVLTLGVSGSILVSPCQAQQMGMMGGFSAIRMDDPAESMVMQQGTSAFVAPRDLNKKKDDTKIKAMGLSPSNDISAKSVAMPLDPAEKPEKPADSVSSPAADPSINAKAVMVDINSESLNYDKDHDVYVATGQVHMVISEQNSELYSDKLTYDRNQELAIAEGKVVIIKNGQRTEGTYAKIDLTRRSALINDISTVVSAVRIKAKQSLVGNHELILEDGKMIISGIMYQQLAANGGLSNIGNTTGKGSQQAKLKREYSKKVYENRAAMYSQLSFEERQLYNTFAELQNQEPNYDDTPDKVSRFNVRAKQIDIVRHEDTYDKITLNHPSLYVGDHKILRLPKTEFSFDGESHNIQYLGPDIGSYRAYGGAYLGPGWDFSVGRGSVRVSPFLSYGSPGFWSSNGKTGKQIDPGLGVGGVVHYRDSKTTADLAYNSRVGSPIGFFDRQLFGQSTHLMGAYNDSYVNGLLAQTERPNYIAQVTDYRVLKQTDKFQITSFGSAGYARDNFYPNFRDTYFVEANKNATPQVLGRVQAQFQLANTAPLLRIGKNVSFGMRAQLITAAYSSADFLAIGRIGPTLNMSLLGNRLNSNIGYTVSHTMGESPFVFDSYIGGKQNVSMNNQFRVNKYLSLGASGSYSLARDNAKKALAVGNILYMIIGPTDIKATVGYDFINQRSYLGLNYFPGAKNTVVNFDKMRITQPIDYTQPNMGTTF